MANEYINSNNIIVFPSALRSQELSGKYTSERNFTTIIKSICELDSFLISAEPNGALTDIECIIDGYYFKFSTNNITDNMTLYINVPADTGLLSNVVDSSITLDQNNIFYGLSLDKPLVFTNQLQIRKNGKWVNKGWISGLTDEDGNWLDLPDKLTQIFTSEGLIDPQYIYDKDFTFKNIKVTDAKHADVADKLGTSTVGSYTQAIYLDQGTPRVAFKVNYSNNYNSAISQITNPQNGDLLFIYK